MNLESKGGFAASILGAAVLLAAMLVPTTVSAEMSAGGFTIRAEDADEAKFFAERGMEAKSTTGPGGPTGPTNPVSNKIVYQINTTAPGCVTPGFTFLGGPRATIDWGDGAKGDVIDGFNSHNYSAPGAYTVSVEGTLPQIVASTPHSNDAYNACIISVPEWGNTGTVSTNGMFAQARNLTTIATPPAGIINAKSMFLQATNFRGDLSKWDVSSVTTMEGMFSWAENFNSDLSGWDVSNVTDMSGLFGGARSFNSDISKWNVSNVTRMSSMFGYTSSFNSELADWNVSNVTDMGGMFTEAMNFNQNISKWNVSNVTDMREMFQRATSFNQDLSTWNVSKVTHMHFMFDGATNYEADLSGWNVASVVKFGHVDWSRNAKMTTEPNWPESP